MLRQKVSFTFGVCGRRRVYIIRIIKWTVIRNRCVRTSYTLASVGKRIRSVPTLIYVICFSLRLSGYMRSVVINKILHVLKAKVIFSFSLLQWESTSPLCTRARPSPSGPRHSAASTPLCPPAARQNDEARRPCLRQLAAASKCRRRSSHWTRRSRKSQWLSSAQHDYLLL